VRPVVPTRRVHGIGDAEDRLDLVQSQRGLPVDATSIRASFMPGSLMINAFGSTMISGAAILLTSANRWWMSRTWVTGSSESTMVSPSSTNMAVTSVIDAPSTGDGQSTGYRVLTGTIGIGGPRSVIYRSRRFSPLTGQGEYEGEDAIADAITDTRLAWSPMDEDAGAPTAPICRGRASGKPTLNVRWRFPRSAWPKARTIRSETLGLIKAVS